MRRREDLLGRHVDDVRDAVGRLLGAGQPAVPVAEPDAKVGAWTGEPERGECPLVERRGAPAKAGDVVAPGGAGVGLVQP